MSLLAVSLNTNRMPIGLSYMSPEDQLLKKIASTQLTTQRETLGFLQILFYAYHPGVALDLWARIMVISRCRPSIGSHHFIG